MQVIWIIRGLQLGMFLLLVELLYVRSQLFSLLSHYLQLKLSIWQEGTKGPLWLIGLVNELGVQQSRVQLHCDSQNAILFAINQIYQARTKHIDMTFTRLESRLHLVRYCYRRFIP